MYDKNQRNFTFKQDYIIEEPHSGQANHAHKTNNAAQIKWHWTISSYDLHILYPSFHYPSEKNPAIVPFFKRN